MRRVVRMFGGVSIALPGDVAVLPSFAAVLSSFALTSRDQTETVIPPHSRGEAARRGRARRGEGRTSPACGRRQNFGRAFPPTWGLALLVVGCAAKEVQSCGVPQLLGARALLYADLSLSSSPAAALPQHTHGPARDRSNRRHRNRHDQRARRLRKLLRVRQRASCDLGIDQQAALLLFASLLVGESKKEEAGGGSSRAAQPGSAFWAHCCS